MSRSVRLLVCWSMLALAGCTPTAESFEQFQLRGPEANIFLLLRPDGTAVFNRELIGASGPPSKFHSTSANWTECDYGKGKKPESEPELKKTTCFIVEVVGSDEQGEARFGMNFVRDGDSLTQLMESGPTFVLKRIESAKRP